MEEMGKTILDCENYTSMDVIFCFKLLQRKHMYTSFCNLCFKHCNFKAFVKTDAVQLLFLVNIQKIPVGMGEKGGMWLEEDIM